MRKVDWRESSFLPKINCPVLVTRRLVLRLPHVEDIEALVKLADNPHISGQFAFMPSPFTRADAEDFVTRAAQGRSDSYIYAVTRADTGEFIGCGGFGGQSGHNAPEAAPAWPYQACFRPEAAAPAAPALSPALPADPYNKPAATEIFFWLGEPYWRQGYGAEIAGALVDAVFRATELEMLYARRREASVAAGKILQKCGFSLLYSSAYVAKGSAAGQALGHYGLSRDCWLDLRRSVPRRAV